MRVDIRRDLDNAKRKHGYGTLSTGEILGLSGLKYLDCIRC